jgi:hypothetical protein
MVIPQIFVDDQQIRRINLGVMVKAGTIFDAVKTAETPRGVFVSIRR